MICFIPGIVAYIIEPYVMAQVWLVHCPNIYCIYVMFMLLKLLTDDFQVVYVQYIYTYTVQVQVQMTRREGS